MTMTTTTPASGTTAFDAAPAVAPVSILMVDDHRANLIALEAILRPLGHELVRAQSGEEAFKHLLQHDFAVILMDVQMPGIDGFRTAALIRQRERNRHIPIIFLTAMSKDAANVLHGYEQGAVDYLLKPFEPEILRSKVSVFVELFQQREQIKRQTWQLRQREREALERESMRRHRNLIDSIPMSIWGMRPDGEVFYCNHVCRELRSLLPGDDMSAAYWAAIHPDDRARLQTAWRRSLDRGEAFELQYRVHRARDGAYRWHLGRTVPEYGEGGEIIGWIATAADIDEQKAISAKLQEAVTARDEFLSTAAHELRTPLASLQLTVQGLLRSFDKSAKVAAKVAGAIVPSQQVVGKLHMIEQMVRRQAKMIEDLLDVSRISAGRLQLELEPCDLLTVAREVVARFEDELKAAGCSLSLRGDEPVTGTWDRTRLDQVVTNLLSNAMKYGHDKPIEMSVESSGGCARVTVTDHGIGIAAQDLGRIFERFARAVPDQNYSGFGLGLWISRQIVEALGGVIRVSSELGVGSAFVVELPQADAGGAEGVEQ
jgi:PAS domain S-box-containing protein